MYSFVVFSVHKSHKCPRPSTGEMHQHWEVVMAVRASPAGVMPLTVPPAQGVVNPHAQIGRTYGARERYTQLAIESSNWWPL